METTVSVENLRRVYPPDRTAVADLSFVVRAGEIVCLAGPNGAGKTSTLRMLGTQLAPTSGRFVIAGIDGVREPRRVRPHLAVVPQEATPDPELTVWQQVYHYLRARGLPRGAAQAAARDTLGALDLADRRDDCIQSLSGGLKRRVLVAMAFASGADVLLLDEPTTGIDPVARRAMWQALLRLRPGRAIVLTTHSMEEAEALADRVLILKAGRVAAEGTVEGLRGALTSAEKILLEDGVDHAALADFGEVGSFGSTVVVYPRHRAARDAVLDLALRQRRRASVAPTTLDDVYQRVVGGAP
jgi:ABC-type multidrug transport system ATPase subunit